MDQELQKKLKESGLEELGDLSITISRSSPEPCLVISAKGITIEHPLKPLKELYAPDNGRSSLDTESQKDLGLLMCIENAIVRRYSEDPDLTDAQVELALDRLDISPSGSPGSDRAAAEIQDWLRLHLSMNAHPLQEVRLAIRKVRKSVQRHTRHSGRTGYLDFIRHQLTRE